VKGRASAPAHIARAGTQVEGRRGERRGKAQRAETLVKERACIVRVGCGDAPQAGAAELPEKRGADADPNEVADAKGQREGDAHRARSMRLLCAL
jgi:hypothetical protein